MKFIINIMSGGSNVNANFSGNCRLANNACSCQKLELLGYHVTLFA